MMFTTIFSIGKEKEGTESMVDTEVEARNTIIGGSARGGAA